MRTTPLFENDILSTVFRNLSYYLGYKNWIIYYLAALLLLWAITKLLAFKNTSCQYNDMFPPKAPGFNKESFADRLGAGTLAFAFLATVIMLYSVELSLFNNYDMMAVNTLYIFKYGVLPMFGVGGRLSPTGFWDMNFIYAISHNLKIVNIYLLLQIGIIAFLLYRFLDFISAGKRLMLIALILLSPQLFWTNNPAYPERMMLIYILSSLIFLKNFSREGGSGSLWLFALFMNLAVFCKENVALFYGGVLLYLVLYDIWIEKITLKSFLHPWQTMRKLPVETLIFINLLIFSLFFLVVVSAFIKDNPYILSGKLSVNPIIIYKTEILISLGVILLLFKNRSKYAFLNAVAFSAVALAVFSLLYIKVGVLPYITTHSHYLVLTVVLGLAYIFYQVRQSKFYCLAAGGLMFFLCLENVFIYTQLEGKYYAAAAQFLASRYKKGQRLNVFIPEKAEKTFWHNKTFNSAFKYYYPGRDVVFSGDVNPDSFALDLAHIRKDTESFYPFIVMDKPQSGNLFLLRKTSPQAAQSMQIIQNLPRSLLYENKVFKIYEMK